jgi:hypothetical protein
VPRRRRDGLLSHILLQAGHIPGERLAVTWVEVERRGAQRAHRHEPEQVYIVVQGRGSIQVGDEEREVGSGELLSARRPPRDREHTRAPSAPREAATCGPREVFVLESPAGSGGFLPAVVVLP